MKLLDNKLFTSIRPLQHDQQLRLTFLESGDIFHWFYHDHQVNLLQANLIDGMISNLYLRVHDQTGYRVSKLIGIHSPSTFSLTNQGAIYQGEVFGVAYKLTLTILKQTWYYALVLTPLHPQNHLVVDVIYGQDVGIAHPFGILSNEAYTSQYIDHQVFFIDGKHTLLSRQNQGLTQFLQIGTDTPTIGYSTDAMQIFGLDYKRTAIPKAYQAKTLDNQNYQYEFAYLALQTAPLTLNETKTIHFYGYTHQQADWIQTTPFTIEPLPSDLAEPKDRLQFPKITNKIGSPIVGLPTSKLLGEQFPSRKLEEYDDTTLLSFFTDNHEHVVTQAKELKVERPHGHILLSGDVLHASEHVFATTASMLGVFGCHTVLGNTNFHKLTGDYRTPFNFHTIAGTRIYVFYQGQYRLLTLPSFFVMELHQATWVYELNDETFIVTLSVKLHTLGSDLTFKTKSGKPYDIHVTQQWLLETNEYAQPIRYDHQGKTLTIFGDSNGMIRSAYPHLQYQIISTQPFTFSPGLTAFIDKVSSDQGMVVLAYEGVNTIHLAIRGTYDKFHTDQIDLYPKQTYGDFIHGLIPLKIESQAHRPLLEKFTSLIPWYVHNALVHYASPHGLEQYNGAAWGTRDVCQGPFELFLTAQRFDINREILLKVFSRQFADSHDYPQWFMFDNYRHIQAHDAHGDVIVWPLKALASYLEATSDHAILHERLAYMDKKTGQFTQTTSTLLEHVYESLLTIQSSFIPHTFLPAYGGGDWDDTLQPANHDLTKSMVSGWTVALLYEALTKLGQMSIFKDERKQFLQTMIAGIKQDYHRYLIADNVPAGFTLFQGDKRTYLLHPSDNQTGLKYRLLPFNRGIISQLFNPEDIAHYRAIINQHLRHPDGVRLMDTAVQYQGGKKTYFQRAETAANFGREIGIQYVHAHIRYIEAMCQLGDGQEAWWGLNVIHPIQIQQTVMHAAYRQSNVYFSSSDAAFFDRYQAKKEFEKIRQGTIPVKAGWRLYSSGPGIYLHQLITKFFGIRYEHGLLVVDPVIPDIFKDLLVTFKYQDQPLKIHFQLNKQVDSVNHRYRKIYPMSKKNLSSHLLIEL